MSGSSVRVEISGGISESSSLTKHAGQLSNLQLRFSVLLLLKGLDLLAISEHQAIICSLTCTRHKAPPRRLRGDAAETHMRIVQDDVKIRVRPEATRRSFRPEARGARPGSAPRRASAYPSGPVAGARGGPGRATGRRLEARPATHTRRP